MAIKRLTLEQNVQRHVGSAESPDDFLKRIRNLGEQVDDILSMQSLTQRQLLASMVLEVNLPDIKNSPKLDKLQPESLGVQSLPKLRKNYAVLQDLYDTLLVVESLEAKIKTGVRRSGDINTDKAFAQTEILKKKIKQGIDNALSFLEGLAKQRHPKALAKFATIVQEALSKSLNYQDIKMRSYVFEEDGVICYSDYIRLQTVIDERENSHPQVFIALTYKTGPKPSVYVAVMKQFEVPGKNTLLRPVKTIQETMHAISMLLDMDGIENSMGSLPVALLTKPGSITKDLFSFESYISTVAVDEHSVVFNLKATVTDRALIDKISAKVFKELQSIVRKSNARLRMTTKKVGRTYALSFYFVTANDTPLVDRSDVKFLQDRFNIDDGTLDKIVNVMNVGV
jgi:hypothetical protein